VPRGLEQLQRTPKRVITLVCLCARVFAPHGTDTTC
jgi:hypothetical protein